MAFHPGKKPPISPLLKRAKLDADVSIYHVSLQDRDIARPFIPLFLYEIIPMLFAVLADDIES